MFSDLAGDDARRFVEEQQRRSLTLLAQSRRLQQTLAEAGGESGDEAVTVRVDASGAVTRVAFGEPDRRPALTELSERLLEHYRRAALSANETVSRATAEIHPDLGAGVADAVPEDARRLREQTEHGTGGHR